VSQFNAAKLEVDKLVD